MKLNKNRPLETGTYSGNQTKQQTNKMNGRRKKWSNA